MISPDDDRHKLTISRDGRILLTCLGGRKPIDGILDEVMTRYQVDKQLFTMVRRPQGGHNWGIENAKPQRPIET